MRRLLDAVRGRKQRRTDYSELPPPPIPLLPAQRPRPITPIETTTASTSESLVAALGTFARLSPELRRRVLIEAFGDRTLHLDLRPAPRGQRPNPKIGYGVEYEHGRGAAPLSWSRIVVSPDVPDVSDETLATAALSRYYKTKAKTGPEWEWEWRWYGCVCHRLVPPGSYFDRKIRGRGRDPYVWPHRDACLQGDSMLCELWPPGPAFEGMHPGARTTCGCAVGALGWLRACRQAYIEGAEVLYATNTFFLQSRDLLEALLCPSPDGGQLFLPHRLAQIRSLELRCELVLFGDVKLPFLSHPSHKDRMRLLPDLAGLAVPFPNLRSLIVSFPDGLYNDTHVRPSARLPEIDRLLLQPLALALAHVAPHMEKHVIVEVPSNVFRDLEGLGLEKERRGDEWSDGRGIWLRYPIDSSVYYYVKQGGESDLYWDYEGRRRWISAAVNRTDPYINYIM